MSGGLINTQVVISYINNFKFLWFCVDNGINYKINKLSVIRCMLVSFPYVLSAVMHMCCVCWKLFGRTDVTLDECWDWGVHEEVAAQCCRLHARPVCLDAECCWEKQTSWDASLRRMTSVLPLISPTWITAVRTVSSPVTALWMTLVMRKMLCRVEVRKMLCRVEVFYLSVFGHLNDDVWWLYVSCPWTECCCVLLFSLVHFLLSFVPHWWRSTGWAKKLGHFFKKVY